MSAELYQFHVLDDGRLADVQTLFRLVFRKKVSIEYLRAKYDTSWCGIRHVCYLAYEAGEPVAFYGALPQAFYFQGRQFLAAHTCDSITLPAHQRKGLHKALAELTYARMRESGLRFVYAFHSENTYHSCKKLHWQEGLTMRGFWMPTSGLAWGKVARRLPLAKSVYARRISRILAEASPPDARRMWAAQAPENGPLRVHYTEAFFAYKSFTQNAIVQCGKVRFWVKCDAVLSVGAAQFEDAADLAAGMAALRSLGKKLGVSRILFQTAPGSALNLWLENQLRGFDSWLVGYLPFEKGLPLDNWEMRFGDLDTF